MKSVFIVRLRSGFLVMEREIAAFTPDELLTGIVVEDDAWNHRDKVGRIAADILNPPEIPPPSPPKEEDTDVPF